MKCPRVLRTRRRMCVPELREKQCTTRSVETASTICQLDALLWPATTYKFSTADELWQDNGESWHDPWSRSELTPALRGTCPKISEATELCKRVVRITAIRAMPCFWLNKLPSLLWECWVVCCFSDIGVEVDRYQRSEISCLGF